MSRKPTELQNHPVDFAGAKAVGLYRAVSAHVSDDLLVSEDELSTIQIGDVVYGCRHNNEQGGRLGLGLDHRAFCARPHRAAATRDRGSSS
jgi:hypothetical protein